LDAPAGYSLHTYTHRAWPGGLGTVVGRFQVPTLSLLTHIQHVVRTGTLTVNSKQSIRYTGTYFTFINHYSKIGILFGDEYQFMCVYEFNLPSMNSYKTMNVVIAIESENMV